MPGKPVIFISAVSKELHSARDLVAKTLLSLGYEPKWQDIAATDTGDLSGVLRKWVDDSDAVIQIIGHCYGFGPQTPDPDFGPCSYTQYEALYARQQSKPVYYIITDAAHPTDGGGSEPTILHDLQAQYRQTVKGYGDLYHSTSSLTQTELLVRRLQDDLAKLRAEGQKQHRSLSQRLALVLVLLLLLVLGGVWLIKGQHSADTKFREVSKGQQQEASTLKNLSAGQAETLQKLNLLLAGNSSAPSNFTRLLRAFVRLPEVLAQTPATEGKRDDSARYFTAYSRLETEEGLPPGTLEKELPGFAKWLLQRPDLDPLTAVQAKFVQRQYAQAETDALAAERVFAAQEHETRQRRIQALQLAGQSAQAQIHYAQAMEHYRAATALTSQERDVLQWLSLQNAISYLYYLQGRYPEGLAHTQTVWNTARQARKDEAPAVLAAHGYYANALASLGQAAAAEPEYRGLIKVQERVLGAEHPDTLTGRNNLANALRAKGKNAEAEQEHRAVLQVRQRVLGAEHPDTLMSRNNLANALGAQGKYAEAEQEHRAVLQVRQRVLGAEHPDTLSSRNNLALALQAQGKHAEAEQEHRERIKIEERVLGAEHPDTLWSRNNLAAALGAQGKHAEAEQQHRALLQVQERVLGAEHPKVAMSCYNLALCLGAQHKLPEALALMQRAEQVWTQVLGPEHPDTKDAKRIRERLEAAGK